METPTAANTDAGTVEISLTREEDAGSIACCEPIVGPFPVVSFTPSRTAMSSRTRPTAPQAMSCVRCVCLGLLRVDVEEIVRDMRGDLSIQTCPEGGVT
jgi:hypothetical protein